jgi:hypothetical protein
MVVGGLSRLKTTLTFLAISMLFCSCVLTSRFHAGASEYDTLTGAKSPAEAEELFSAYPIEKQIDIYLFGLKYVEPGDSSTQKFLVKGGAAKLPTIIHRIQDANGDFDKAYLMEVVARIDKDCNCVTDDQKSALSRISFSIKNGYHRGRSLRAFEELNK